MGGAGHNFSPVPAEKPVAIFPVRLQKQGVQLFGTPIEKEGHIIRYASTEKEGNNYFVIAEEKLIIIPAVRLQNRHPDPGTGPGKQLKAEAASIGAAFVFSGRFPHS